MTTVIADLVARVRSEGVAQTGAEVKAIGDSATVTAKALENMAAQFAKLNGGTAAEALSMFQRSGVQPTASALADAAKAMEQTATAAARAVEPTRAAARAASEHATATGAAAKAAEDVGKGWSASESSLVRFGAGLVGVSLGISLVAGAARLVHDAISSVVSSQFEWEQSLVRTKVLYGGLSSSIVALSQAQAQAPGLLGTQQEFLSANLNAGYLNTRFGLSTGSISGLTSAAGRVSSAYGYGEAERADLQARALAFAEGGGSGLRGITGTEGAPIDISRRLGGVSAAQLQALTPQQLREAQTRIASVDLNQAALTGDANTRGLVTLQADKERLLAQAQSNLQNNLENATGGYIQGPTTGERSLTRSILEYGEQPAQMNVGPGDVGARQAAQAAQAAFEEAAKAVKSTTAALEEGRTALAQFGVEVGTAAFRLLGFGGNLEDRYGIARGDVGAQAQAGVASRAVGPNPLIYRTPAEMGVGARESAEQQAYQSYVAEQARQTQRDSGSAIREFLNSQTQTGPGANRAAAQSALDEIQRRALAATIGGQAQQAGGFAQRAQTEADSQLSTISVQQDERRLSVAEDLANLRREALGYEAQMAPLLNQQANLQDRLVVASRDNLDSRRALIQAEQAALPSQNRMQDITYEQQLLRARADASRAAFLRGGQTTEDIANLRKQYYGLDIDRAENAPGALQAQHAVDMAQRTRTAEGLGRDLTLTNLEGEQRALQDQLIPLTEKARLAQAEQDTISRTLELIDLEDVKAVTAAKHAVDSATLLALQAGSAERAAADMAANMDLGATAADRWAAAIDKGAKILAGIGNARDQQADVDARIANGLGGGGIGPAPGQSPSTVNRIPGFQIIVNGNTPDQVKTQVHIMVEDALNQFFAGSATTGAPAPSNVGGAGR